MSEILCSEQNCSETTVGRGLCAKHYKRWQRAHNETSEHRPEDWGLRKNHPAHRAWQWIKNRRPICEEWRNDFWKFAVDVGEKPEGCRLERKDNTKPYSKENFVWRKFPMAAEDVRAKQAARMRKWHENNPHKELDYNFKRNYGISREDYDAMLEEQNHRCKICGETERPRSDGKVLRLSVDHCHDTRQVRGLLCTKCNMGLGYYDHSIERLRSAIEYLMRS